MRQLHLNGSFSEGTTDPPTEETDDESTGASTNTYALAFCIFIIVCLAVALAITRITTPRVEIGRVFRNSLYRQYYIGDQRIDLGVVEAADRNPNYSRDNDDTNETVIEDANPHYARKVMTVDEDGYATISYVSSGQWTKVFA